MPNPPMTSIVFCCLLIVLWTLNPARADEPKSASTPCDAKYFESVKSRAWLEVQREITQNQNLINKPDSVLQYTCFNNFLGPVVATTGSRFSKDSGRMQNALTDLVANTVHNFVLQNYQLSAPPEDVRALGGRPSGNSLSLSVSNSAPSTAYNCNAMQNVWHLALCTDFIENVTSDGFFTFKQYSDAADAADHKDKRMFPTPMACTSAVNTWAPHMDAAGLTLIPPAWSDDPLITVNEQIDPASCGDDAYPPIPTGLRVTRPDINYAYQEYLCAQPGCYYNPKPDDELGTCSKTPPAKPKPKKAD